MPKILFSDKASTTMSGTLASGLGTLNVAPGGGAKFPAPTGGDFFYATMYQKDVGGAEINVEVVKISAKASADSFTIAQRDVTNITGYGGGYAYPGTAGTVYVELRWLEKAAAAMMQADDLSAGNIANTPTGGIAATTVQAALNELDAEKASLASPAFTGTPTVPTAGAGTNTTQAASTQFVTGAVSTHSSATAAHGVTGNIVGTTDTQTLTNKTIVAANNTITTAASGNLAATNLNAALAELQADIDTRQVSDATLTALAGVITAANKLIYATGADTFATTDLTAAGRALLDDADAAAQRATLGLGTAATLNVGTAASNVVQLDGTGKLPAVDGSQLTGVSSLPAQTGNSGKYLSTNGASASWQTVDVSSRVAKTGDTMSGSLTVQGTGVIGLSNTGDITCYRAGGTTGVIFLSSAGNKYLYFNGTNYEMPGGNLFVNGSQVLTTANGSFSSYVPKDFGSGSYPVGVVIQCSCNGIGGSTRFSPGSTASGSLFTSPVGGGELPGTWRNVGDSNSYLSYQHAVVIQRVS